MTTPLAKILLVEDDKAMRESCRQILRKVPYEVMDAALPKEAEAILLREEFDLVVTDLRMPQGGGQEVLRAARKVSPDLPVILITAYPSVQSAVEAFKGGVTDYLTKPFTVEQLRQAVQAALRTSQAKDRADLLRRMGPSDPAAQDLIGQSPRTLAFLSELRRVARLEAHVLISGEPGSGKDLAARTLHRFSNRASGRFVAASCAALEESPLAGSGDVLHKALEQARGGILYLDELSDLAPGAQARLLGIPDSRRETTSPASDVPRPSSDIRIVASTRKDLLQDVQAGRFREDHYYRLTSLEIRVPPLRERPQDIPGLAVHFLDRFAAELDARKIVGLGEDALGLLVEHSWPGNVRELANVLRNAVARATGPLITKEDLLETGALAREAGAADEPASPRRSALDDYERKYLAGMLASHSGNVTQTAQALGIHRTTLQRLMKKFGIAGSGR
ncbi:MAG: sigma-54-dependent Fis family transcriptional regulator [Nitrospirae bacterium]|nr:sigma-54-dependent Fis family transcriptional regulator [Nitrospirota bacterium]